MTKIQQQLADPFEPSEIEWRVQRSGVSGAKGWAMVNAYITARAVQKRLDDVFGVDGWENSYRESGDGKGFICQLRCKFGDRWVSKEDAAEYSNVEALKGAMSDSLKRVAVQFGIGRYLYQLDTIFVACEPIESRFKATGNYIGIKKDGVNGRLHYQWFTPQLPRWAMPSVKADEFKAAMTAAKTQDELKQCFGDAYRFANGRGRKDLLQEFTQIKDAIKAKLQEAANSQAQAVEDSETQYTIAMIANRIASAENYSVLKIAYNEVRQESIRRAEVGKFNPHDYLKLIDTAFQKRKKELGQ